MKRVKPGAKVSSQQSILRHWSIMNFLHGYTRAILRVLWVSKHLVLEEESGRLHNCGNHHYFVDMHCDRVILTYRSNHGCWALLWKDSLFLCILIKGSYCFVTLQKPLRISLWLRWRLFWFLGGQFGTDSVVNLQIADCLRKGCDLEFSLRRRLRQHLPRFPDHLHFS